MAFTLTTAVEDRSGLVGRSFVIVVGIGSGVLARRFWTGVYQGSEGLFVVVPRLPFSFRVTTFPWGAVREVAVQSRTFQTTATIHGMDRFESTRVLVWPRQREQLAAIADGLQRVAARTEELRNK